MAAAGHCAYCFEVLAADLENRKPLSYRQVQELWEQYQLLGQSDAGEEQAVQDGGELEDGDSGMEGLEEDEDEGKEENEEEHGGVQEQKSLPSTLQLPSISRLRAPSPGTPSSSSSTGSSLSTTSSQAALGGSNSKSSSNSSFFSFGSRSKQPSPAVPKEEEHPLFITWNTISSRGHKSLRGCIGTFDAQELSTGLKSYALTAAFDDTRFAPITHRELPTLSCSTTLLTHFTPTLHPLDWTLGQHGIRIAFTYHNKRYGATYLPDVAVEQGWTKEETLVSLMRKAGCSSGKVGGWRDLKGGMDVVRYEGRKATVGWREWRAWREWVVGLGVR